MTHNTHEQSLIERVDEILSRTNDDAIDVDIEQIYNETIDAIDNASDDVTRAMYRVSLRALALTMHMIEHNDNDALDNVNASLS